MTGEKKKRLLEFCDQFLPCLVEGEDVGICPWVSSQGNGGGFAGGTEGVPACMSHLCPYI